MADEGAIAGKLSILVEAALGKFKQELESKVETAAKNVAATVGITLHDKAEADLRKEVEAVAEAAGKGVVVKVKVEADTGSVVAETVAAAEAAEKAAPAVTIRTRVDSFVNDMRKRVTEVATKVKPKVKVKADTSTVVAETVTAAEAAEAAAPTITIRTRVSSFIGELRRKIVEARAEANAAAAAEAAMGGVRGGRGLSPRMLFRGSIIFGLVSLVQPLIGAIGQIVAGLTAMTSAALPAVNTLAAIPISIGAIIQGFVAGKVATQGFGEALGLLAEEQAALARGEKLSTAQQEKLNQALDELSPSAEKAARALVPLREEWVKVREDVQEALFSKIHDQIKPLAEKMLPLLRRELSRTSGTLGRYTAKAMEFLSSDEAQADIGKVMKNNNVIFGDFLDMMGSFGKATIDFFVGSRRFGRGVGDLMRDVGDWAQNKAARGREKVTDPEDPTKQITRLDLALRKASERGKQLWNILRQFGGGLAGIFRAGEESGVRLLDDFETFLTKWNKWANDDAGQKRLKKWFDGAEKGFREIALLGRDTFKGMAKWAEDPKIAGMIEQLRTELGPALGKLLEDIANISGPGTIDFLTQLTELAQKATPALEPLSKVVGFLTDVLRKLNEAAEANPGTAKFLAQLVGFWLAFKATKGLLKLAFKITGLGKLATAASLVSGFLPFTKGGVKPKINLPKFLGGPGRDKTLKGATPVRVVNWPKKLGGSGKDGDAYVAGGGDDDDKKKNKRSPKGSPKTPTSKPKPRIRLPRIPGMGGGLSRTVIGTLLASYAMNEAGDWLNTPLEDMPGKAKSDLPKWWASNNSANQPKMVPRDQWPADARARMNNWEAARRRDSLPIPSRLFSRNGLGDSSMPTRGMMQRPGGAVTDKAIRDFISSRVTTALTSQSQTQRQVARGHIATARAGIDKTPGRVAGGGRDTGRQADGGVDFVSGGGKSPNVGDPAKIAAVKKQLAAIPAHLKRVGDEYATAGRKANQLGTKAAKSGKQTTSSTKNIAPRLQKVGDEYATLGRKAQKSSQQTVKSTKGLETAARKAGNGVKRAAKQAAESFDSIPKKMQRAASQAGRQAGQIEKNVKSKTRTLPGTVRKAMDGVVKAVSSKAGPAKAASNKVGNGVKEPLSKLNGPLNASGVNAMAGFKAGIESEGARAVAAARSIAAQVAAAANAELDIRSPSRVFMRTGRFSMEGLEQGLVKHGGRPVAAALNITKNIVKGVNSGLDQIKNIPLDGSIGKGLLNRLGLGKKARKRFKEQIKEFLTGGFRSAITSGTPEQITKAFQKLYSKIEKKLPDTKAGKRRLRAIKREFRDEMRLLRANAKAREAVQKQIAEARARLDEILAKRDAMRDAFKSAGDEAGDIRNIAAANGGFVSPGRLIAQLKRKVAKALEFKKLLADLRAKGLGEEGYQQLVELGFDEGLPIARQLAKGDAAALKEITALQTQLDDIAGDAAKESEKHFFAGGIKAGEAMIKQLQDDLDKLEDVAKKMGKAFLSELESIFGLDLGVKNGGNLNANTGKDDGGKGGGNGGMHKWVPKSKKNRDCKTCGKARNTAKHTNRTDANSGVAPANQTGQGVAPAKGGSSFRSALAASAAPARAEAASTDSYVTYENYDIDISGVPDKATAAAVLDEAYFQIKKNKNKKGGKRRGRATR